MNLTADRFQYEMKRLAIAIDPSYVSKAGKKTAHIGRFWSWYAMGLKYSAFRGLRGLKIRLVIHYLPNGDHRLYFPSDTAVCGKDVYDIYRTRFQIEFCFHKGHLDCQPHDEKTLDFAYNASLAEHHKGVKKAGSDTFSIGLIKSLMATLIS